MIDLKKATEKAKGFIVEMEGEQKEFHLESALLSSDKKNWEVVFSYKKSLEHINDLQKILGLKERKIYKKVIIDNDKIEIIGYSDAAFDKSVLV